MACRFPKKDSSRPVNGNVEKGTCIPTLAPTIPTSAYKCRAVRESGADEVFRDSAHEVWPADSAG